MNVAFSSGAHRSLAALLACGYAAFLVLVYISFIVPVFGYMGFSGESINFDKCVEAMFVTLLLSLTLPTEFRHPSDFLIFLLLFLTVIPVLLVMGVMDKDRFVAITIVCAYLLIWIVNQLPAIRLPRIAEGQFLFWLLSLGGLGVTVLWIFVSGAYSGFSLDLATIYDVRGEQSEALQVGPFAYLTNWTFKVINPLLIVLAYRSRLWIAVFALLVLQMFFFGVSAHKSVAAIPFLVLGTYIVITGGWKPVGLVTLAIVGTACAYVVALTTGFIAPASYLVRRALFVPADLHFSYFEYFGQAGFVGWSNSILSSFFHYPYDYPTPKAVSIFLYGHPDIAANAGFLATGYMHFGLFGVVMFSLIVAMLFRVVDGLASYHGMALTLSTVLPGFLWAFTSSDLTPALLTHGLLLSVFLLLLFAGQPIRMGTAS